MYAIEIYLFTEGALRQNTIIIYFFKNMGTTENKDQNVEIQDTLL